MSKEHTTEHLRAELKSLSDTLEEVLSSSGEKSKEELSKIRSKAEQALKQSRYRLGETGDAIAKQTRVAAARADEYVRENPWTGVGIGAAIGVVLGVLLAHGLKEEVVVAPPVVVRQCRPRGVGGGAHGSLWLTAAPVPVRHAGQRRCHDHEQQPGYDAERRYE